MDSDTSARRIPSVEEDSLLPPQIHQEEQRRQVKEEEEASSNLVSSVPGKDGSKASTLPVSSPKLDQEIVTPRDPGVEGKAFLCDSVSGSPGPDCVVEKIENSYLEPQDNRNPVVGLVSNGGGSTVEGKGTKQEDLLEAKKKQLLMELECGSLLKNKTCEGIEGVLDVSQGILGCLKGIGADFVGDTLKIEVIDDTALVIPVGANGCAKPKSRGQKKEKKCENGEKDGKNVKPPDQRRKHGRELEMMGWEKKESCIGEAGKPGDRVRIKYSRDEMESLRFVNIVEQRKMWRGIYAGLEHSVRKGYDDLASSKHQKQKLQSNFDPKRQQPRRRGAPGILGEVSSENVDSESSVEGDVVNANKVDDCWKIGGEGTYKGSEGECSEEGDSDEDYTSIQRPAFLVEGEPNFESGPPEDGLEYLRRVRWEAAHMPKVKVAKLDRSKVNEVQSFYMPQIPDIPKCPEHLLPLKQWEDEFLDDFSNLRQVLSCEEGSGNELSVNLNPLVTVTGDSASMPCLVDTKFSNIRPEVHSRNASGDESLGIAESIINCEDNNSSTSHDLTPKDSLKDATSNGPTFSAIMAMDSVARGTMLKSRIALAESMNSLSKDDCVWLFALFAAVDTPLLADTCAAIRSLLRKCATLRAEKSELDDEVVMLNILATIAGRFFGQAES